MSFNNSNSLSNTLTHAITYLTFPIILSYPAAQIVQLRRHLHTNLTALFAPSWVTTNPSHGSGRRCLTLSPGCLPARPVYAACLSAGVQWFDWMKLMGGREFDLFIDPGRIRARFEGIRNGLITIWSDEVSALAGPTATTGKDTTMDESKLQNMLRAQAASRAKKTLAQELLEEDELLDGELFAMIARKVTPTTTDGQTEKTWMSSLLDEFPAPAPISLPRLHSVPILPDYIPRSTSPISRSSSRSSDSNSIFSFTSGDSGTTFTSDSTTSLVEMRKTKGPVFEVSISPSTPPCSTTARPPRVLSRREKARLAHMSAYIDRSKVEVTSYDGGKVGVLTGGVMLGGGAVKASGSRQGAKRQSTGQAKDNKTLGCGWRSARV
jgi:BTG family